MIDLTDSFPEGFKIFKKENFRRKPVPEIYRCRIKRMLVVADSSMYLSKCKRVHVASVSRSGVSQSMLEVQLLRSHRPFGRTLICGHQSIGTPVICNQAHSAYL